jgi:hypothetical protein
MTKHHYINCSAAVLTLALVGTGPCSAGGESPPLAYRLHCSGCHLEDGLGSTVGQIPPIPGLAGHFLKHEKGRLYLAHVPGVVNSGLPPGELASLLNYVLETWGANDLPPKWDKFTGAEIAELSKVTVHDISLLRKEIAADLAKQGIDLKY